MSLSTKPRTRFNPRPAHLRTVEPTEHKQRIATHEWVNCPVCAKAFVGAAVVTGKPEQVKQWGISNFTGTVVYRRMFCDGCDTVYTWYQEISQGRMGVEIPHKGMWGMLPKSANEAFLREHPQAAGVAQS